MTVATLVARNANVTVVAPMVACGGVCVSWESAVRRSVLCWYVWQGSGFSSHEDVFAFNLLRNFINSVI